MASSISQIKQQVAQIGTQATSLAGQLNQLSTELEKNIAAVTSAIGGTATGEDKTMVAAFENASKSVKEAAASLNAAGQSAKDWAANA